MTDTIFTHDAATVSWDSVETDGITVDDDGTASFDWSEIPVVRLDEPPHAEAFDTDEFYKIEGATVARPIKQPYRVGDSIDWYKKPADELRKMAWSLDNAPFTLGHPDTGMVKDVNDIHGFWKEPRYDGDEERLKEDLYIPTNESDATEFVSEHQDVSIGFYNRVHSEYDGDTGDLMDDDVDGFQVNMYGDHVAGVTQGRCSSEQGCGLDAQDNHGHVVMRTEGPDLEGMTDSDYDIAPSFDGDFTTDYRNSEGTYFAVGPDENPDDEPKYPINNCEDARDAWNLRTQGNISISVEDLEGRIKRRAAELDCRLPSTARQDEGCGCGDTNEDDNNMSDGDTDDGFDIPDMSIDALAERHDTVASIREEKDELAETVSEVRDELAEHGIDLEEDECPCDAIHDLAESKDEAESRVEDLEDELDDYREEERQEALDTLGEYLDDTEEYQDADLDEIQDEIERVEKVAENLNVDVKNVETTDSESGGSTGRKRHFGRGHGTGE